MKYSKNALKTLTARYRSVLKKCALIALGVFFVSSAQAAEVLTSTILLTGSATGEVKGLGAEQSANVVTQSGLNEALTDKLNRADLGTVTQIYNGVLAENNVNQNIDALNGKIGDMQGLSQTNNTLVQAQSLVSNLNNLDNKLGNSLFSAEKGNLTASGNLTQALNELDTKLGANADLGDAINGVSADKSLKANIGAVNSALGNIGELPTANGNLSAESVAASLSKLDGRLGSDDEITNAYNGVLAENSLKKNMNTINGVLGNTADLSETNGILAAEKSLVENLNNVDALIGNKALINTADGGNVTEQSIIGALNQLDNEIGNNTDYGTALNGISADASLKANLTALSSKVGDTAQLADGSTVGDTVTAETVVGAINQIDDKIGAVAEISYEKNNVAQENTINTNLNNINMALGDTSQMANEKGDTVADAQDASTAINRIDGKIGATTEIKHTYNGVNGANTVHGNIEALNSTIGDITKTGVAGRNVSEQLWTLNEDFHDLRDEVRGSFAATAALAGLVPNARATNDTQISIGTGAYHDEVGFAVGAFHYVNDNILLNAGAAYGGSESAMFKAGITFGW